LNDNASLLTSIAVNHCSLETVQFNITDMVHVRLHLHILLNSIKLKTVLMVKVFHSDWLYLVTIETYKNKL